MARKFANHPWHYHKQVDQEEKDLKASAGLLASVPEKDREGYSTMLEIAKYAGRYGRGLEAVEEEIEKLVSGAYAERKGGRFIRLTRKGRELISLY